MIPGSVRFPGEGNGNPLHYSCLENSIDRGAWQATAHGVEESDTTEQLNTHTQDRGKLLIIQGTQPGSLWHPREVAWGLRGKFKREGIYVYLWLIHTVV